MRGSEVYSERMDNFLTEALQFISTNFPQHKRDETSSSILFLSGENELVVYSTWGKVFQYTNNSDINGTIVFGGAI